MFGQIYSKCKNNFSDHQSVSSVIPLFCNMTKQGNKVSKSLMSDVMESLSSDNYTVYDQPWKVKSFQFLTREMQQYSLAMLDIIQFKVKVNEQCCGKI